MRGAREVRGQVHELKEQLRRQIITRRSRMRLEDLRGAAIAMRDVLLQVPEVGRAAVLAAYVGVGTEPGTGPLLEALTRRGVRVLLPVVMTDRDLDWVEYSGSDDLVRAPLGTLEPTGPRLGAEAVATADAVLIPGLAVDRHGLRLGRGGGSYDRALTRVAPEAFSCVLLHDGEVLDNPVPQDPHDRRVLAAATPSGLVRFSV